MTPLLDINAAARVLGISPWTVRAYIAQGKLQPVRLGRRVLLQEQELERFVNAGKGDSASERGANNG